MEHLCDKEWGILKILLRRYAPDTLPLLPRSARKDVKKGVAFATPSFKVVFARKVVLYVAPSGRGEIFPKSKRRCTKYCRAALRGNAETILPCPYNNREYPVGYSLRFVLDPSAMPQDDE